MCNMPMMNGFAVQLRLREISPCTRVIMLTANNDPLVLSTALSFGASAFFTKPFDGEQFLNAIRVSLTV